MDSIQIETGEIALSVNGDEKRVIRFNPHDHYFAERYYNLRDSFDGDEVLKDIERRIEKLRAKPEDEQLPEEINKLAIEFGEFMNKKIDNLFGVGTSLAAFNGVVDLGDEFRPSMYETFFEAISPYFQRARTEKLNRYLPPDRVKRGKSKSQKPARGTGRKRKK